MPSNLPIDVIPNTKPLRFKWRQMISTPVGQKSFEHEGPMPPSLEPAVEALICIAKQLETERDSLRTENDSLKKSLEEEKNKRPSTAGQTTAPTPTPVAALKK